MTNNGWISIRDSLPEPGRECQVIDGTEETWGKVDTDGNWLSADDDTRLWGVELWRYPNG